MTTLPTIPRHPLDRENVTKIALGQSASDALAALGEFHLVLATKADSTAPDAAQGRIILLCLPCSKELANDLFKVANGKARVVTIKPPKP